jgi:hypothetical protein
MSAKIVNITRHCVDQKIEEIIRNTGSPCDSLFTNPDLRQKLIVRVLNDAPPNYVFCGDAAANVQQQETLTISLEEEMQIVRLIHENIMKILQEENAFQSFTLHSPALENREPSHWFG